MSARSRHLILAGGALLALLVGLSLLLQGPQEVAPDGARATEPSLQGKALTTPAPPSSRAASASLSEAPQPTYVREPGPQSFLPTQFGSEGYAPWIRKVLETDHPGEAAEAVELMNACLRKADMEDVIRAREDIRDGQGRDLRPALLESLHRHQRRCQTLTPDLYAQRLMLAQRAVDGQWPGAPRLMQDLLQNRQLSEEENLLVALRETAARYRMEQARKP